MCFHLFSSMSAIIHHILLRQTPNVACVVLNPRLAWTICFARSQVWDLRVFQISSSLASWQELNIWIKFYWLEVCHLPLYHNNKLPSLWRKEYLDGVGAVKLLQNPFECKWSGTTIEASRGKNIVQDIHSTLTTTSLGH